MRNGKRFECMLSGGYGGGDDKFGGGGKAALKSFLRFAFTAKSIFTVKSP